MTSYINQINVNVLGITGCKKESFGIGQRSERFKRFCFFPSKFIGDPGVGFGNTKDTVHIICAI